MKNCLIILTVLTLTGCAGLYRSIEPENMEYFTYSKLNDSVDISYNYNTQAKFNNKKYRKAERKSGFVAVSIKIVNNSSDTINILPNTLLVNFNGKPADIITYKDYVEDVKQATAIYLVYGIFGPWVTNNGSTSYIPIGLGIGLLNLGVASYANNRHEKDMKKLEIWGKSIKPKSSANGIIFLRNYTYDEIKFVYLKY